MDNGELMYRKDLYREIVDRTKLLWNQYRDKKVVNEKFFEGVDPKTVAEWDSSGVIDVLFERIGMVPGQRYRRYNLERFGAVLGQPDI